jgi:type I restriction enzyme, S subunit
MTEWSATPISALLATSFAGEWGAEPDGGPTEATVLRGADFTSSGRFGPGAGVVRAIPSGKLRKLALRPGDILLEKSGGGPDQPVGRVSLYDGGAGTAVSSNFLQTLRPRAGVDAEFLFYLLQHEYRTGRVMPFQQQTTGLINFRLKDYLKEEVLVPTDRREQRRIALLLSTVDDVVAQTEMLVDKEAARATGLMQRLFPLGFVQTADRIGVLSDALDGIEGGKSFMCLDQPASAGEWGVLKVSAIRPDGFVGNENKLVENLSLVNPRYEVKHGDLLMTRANTQELVGAACLADTPQARLLLCDKTLRLLPSAGVFPEYLWLWLQTPRVRRYIDAHATGTSAGMKNLSQGSIRHIPLELPSYSQQFAAAAPLVAQFIHMRELRTTVQKLKKLKAGLAGDQLSRPRGLRDREESK